ncbi:MAG TPA: bifunctional 5,10-methylenetetrahydrofolate dehydrogenase/5,10-methenyltetrahydrofolate cyclohydrolase [Armatimonadota bacterium]|jgi:methylenetetrahydrofolate dehydrogenase (NADP+)/methenyltetrahydrofolate cyclohydrolase
MAAIDLEGKSVAAQIRGELKAEAAGLTARLGRAPLLATLQVGEDPASEVYARRIAKTLAGVGIQHSAVNLPTGSTAEDLRAALETLGRDPTVDGILPLLPVPAPLTQADVVRWLRPEQDVDGIHPINAGLLALGQEGFVPNTPAGGMELLRRYDIPLKGRRAVVVGRSNIVGKPMALLLLAEHATVTLCHSRTVDLPAVVREGDIVVAAVGRAGLIKGDWLKPGATVIDFGINATDTGITGDVDYASAREVAGAITPVPGGTGPVTNLMLARNTLLAARHRL